MCLTVEYTRRLRASKQASTRPINGGSSLLTKPGQIALVARFGVTKHLAARVSQQLGGVILATSERRATYNSGRGRLCHLAERASCAS